MVSTETATAIGYRNRLVTFRFWPSEAMMKENSPIWASPIPTRREVRVSWPDKKVPKVQLATCPTITARLITTIGFQYCASSTGSIIRPMATKNTALNMSRTGSISASIRWISRDSAITAPMRKAPSATLYPSFRARRDRPKHSPSTVTNSVSWLRNRAT